MILNVGVLLVIEYFTVFYLYFYSLKGLNISSTATIIIHLFDCVFITMWLTFKLLATLDELLHQSGHLWMGCLVIMGWLKNKKKLIKERVGAFSCIVNLEWVS